MKERPARGSCEINVDTAGFNLNSTRKIQVVVLTRSPGGAIVRCKRYAAQSRVHWLNIKMGYY